MTIKLKRFIITAFLNGLIGTIGLLNNGSSAKAICLNRIEPYQTIQSKFTSKSNLRISVQTISNYQQLFQYTINANLEKATLPSVGISTSLFLKIIGVFCILAAVIIYVIFFKLL